MTNTILLQASLAGALPRQILGQPVGVKAASKRLERSPLRAIAEAEEDKRGLSFSANRNAVSSFDCQDVLSPVS